MIIIKSLGHFDQKWGIATLQLEHCDVAVGALRLGLGHSGRGALAIATIIRSVNLVSLLCVTVRIYCALVLCLAYFNHCAQVPTDDSDVTLTHVMLVMSYVTQTVIYEIESKIIEDIDVYNIAFLWLIVIGIL